LQLLSEIFPFDKLSQMIQMAVFFILAEQEISLDRLWLMNEETLQTVIPKAGPRAVLLDKIRQVRV
jgi:hypothetical protein